MSATTEMSTRERWLAAVDMQPVDRLPFWPKLNPAYPPNQSGAFRDMALADIHRYVGSDRHDGIGLILREKRTHAVTSTTSDAVNQITTYRSTAGETRSVHEFDTTSQSWHPVEFPVKDLESLKAMTAFYEDTHVVVDPQLLEDAQAKARQLRSEDVITKAGIGESPLMHWVEWLAGVENAHYFLMDFPEEVEALFAQMHRVLRQKAELMCRHAPCDLLYLTENTSTSLISPEQYRRYCLPHIGEYAAIAEQGGRRMVLHMCGLLKDLLPDIGLLPVKAFEAFTSPPVGNTRFLDGRTACPEKCLVGGTNAVLWTRTADEIIAEIERDLDALPHHRGIVVTSAGVMPPLAAPDTIKTVCEWVKQYPLRT